MNGISPVNSDPATGDVSIQLAMLKQTQDMMKQQGAALLAALPPPLPAPSVNSPGMGSRIDIRA